MTSRSRSRRGLCSVERAARRPTSGSRTWGSIPSRRYLVFEFWQKRLVGEFTAAFGPGPLPAPFNSQVFIVRERLDRPQLVATGRHITGGEPDLLDVQWQNGVLSGRSLVVGGDPYEIYLTEPAGWRLVGVECDGAEPSAIARESGLSRATCRADTSREVAWRARYERQL